jgi:hypothetical protein
MKNMPEENKIESHESPIKIHFEYGVDIDTDRLKSTIDKLPWYREKGYIHIKIPEGLTELSTREDVAKVVASEYSENKYKEISEKITELWQTFSIPFQELKQIPDFHFGENYGVFLTGYGVGGSYHSDVSEIIVDVGRGDIDWIMKVMAHEIVHTGIEYLIQKYEVPHWKKERLVDLICDRYFSRGKQGIRENVDDVDEVFNVSWPDIDTITKKIGAIK